MTLTFLRKRVVSVKPVAFLVKPFKKEDLFTAIELAIHQQQQKDQQLDDTYDRIAVKRYLCGPTTSFTAWPSRTLPT